MAQHTLVFLFITSMICMLQQFMLVLVWGPLFVTE